ncbi:ANTAR domain-containing response regulator [Castellaniella sp.]|uniref:ANTAR domain-containing response regulator n=1 Tax=Castellaniella sp. TaxID=1955812 RepID=UPI003C752E23
MNSAPCVKNFSRRRALIVTDDTATLDRLCVSLGRVGVLAEAAQLQSEGIDLRDGNLCTERDILFLDGDLNLVIHVPSYEKTAVPLIPIIGMVGIEAPSRLERLFAYGATAFIKKPIYAGAVFPSLFMSINGHLQRLQLTRYQHKQDMRRGMRRYVMKAVLMIMEEKNLTDEEAYDCLRRTSMNMQTSIEDLCKQMVEQESDTSMGVNAC